jgi:thiamine pyrophosphokinase
MNIIIIANGTINNLNFHKKLIKQSDLIVCADGGANHCPKLKIAPNFVIGDLDSIKPALLKKFKNSKKTKVIYDPDQNKLDLELAIKLAESFKPEKINIIGALGDRMDHTLANIICLGQINRKIKAKIINEKNEIELVDKICEIKGKKGDIVSIIPLDLVKGLTYTGLKWGVKNKSVDLGWLGICNKMTGNKATIKLQQGKVLVIRSR